MSEPRQAGESPAGQVKDRTRRSKDRRPPEIRVDRSLCKSCGICVKLCPKDVFDRDPAGGPVLARLADCTGCRFCELHCPDFALEVLKPAAVVAQDRGADAADGRDGRDESPDTVPAAGAADDEGVG